MKIFSYTRTQTLFLSFCLSVLIPNAAYANSCSHSSIQGQVDQLTNTAEAESLDAASRSLIACGEDTIAPLLLALKDNHYNRSWVAYTLGQVGASHDSPSEVVPKLINFFDNKDADIRLNAIYALAQIGPSAKDAVPKLIKTLSDSDADVRAETAKTLGDIGPNAKDAVPELIKALEDTSADVRSEVAETLGDIGPNAKDAVPELINALSDADADVRAESAYALGEIGPHAKSAVPELIRVFKEDPYTWSRANTITALGKVGIKNNQTSSILIEAIQDNHSAIRCRAAWSIGELGEQSEEFISVLVTALSDENTEVCVNSVFALGQIGISEDINEIPNLLVEILQDKSRQHLVRQEALESLEEISLDLQRRKESLSKNQLDKFIEQLEAAQDAVQTEQAIFFTDKDIADIQDYIDVFTRERKSRWIRAFIQQGRLVWLGHVCLWSLLIIVYPKSSQVQAIFFWNPWIRKFLGAGYVGFLLTWIPFLRQKIFTPFRESLLADAHLEDFDATSYFQDSKVKLHNSEKAYDIEDAIPEIKKQIVLVGNSGLGKSLFLKNLIQKSTRIIVYLQASKCEDGVIQAIQKKLHGEEIKDAQFLQNLIYSGAIDICIDGLNEVSAGTRAKIVEFTENYFKGNIILATQPMEWIPPSTATVYELQPLEKIQIKDFLISRKSLVPNDAPINRNLYESACLAYLKTVFSEEKSREEINRIQYILTNPMDLTVVASMIAAGKQPDIFRLNEQQYTVMADDYNERHIEGELPLELFSETVYEMRLNDKNDIPEETFLDELICLERHKMIVIRHSISKEEKAIKEWYFRHDKVMEFFLLKAFLFHLDRQEKHLSDPRFRGVYFSLANFLELKDAILLREMLIQHAADTKDHTVSDTFVQLLRSRQENYSQKVLISV